MNERAKRMNIAIDKSDMSLREVSEQTGISKSALQRYIKGETVKIPIDVIESVAAATGTAPEWIMGWDEKGQPLGDEKYPNNLYKVETVKIPLLGTIAAGEPVFADEPWETSVDTSIGIKADFCLKVKGDSMEQANIHDGDTVFVRKQHTAHNGDIAVVMIDNEATLKRVYFNKDEITLVAENPKYPPRTYRVGNFENVRILGKAIAYQSYL